MIYLVAALFFVLLQAFFSGIETGLVSLRKPRVLTGVRNGDRRAAILCFFMERPSLMLATILLGSNICVVGASLMVKESVRYFGFSGSLPMLAGSIILTIVLLAAEIIPKDWFRQAPYLRCSAFAGMLRFCYLLLYVPSLLLARFTDGIIALLTGNAVKQDASILLREEIRILLRESEDGGIINVHDANVLDNAIDFSRMTVKDVMTGRPEVRTVPADSTVAMAVAICRDSGYSRLPVTVANGGSDGKGWIGFFSIYDAIHKVPESAWRDTRVNECLRTLNMISADSELSEVMRRAKLGKSPLLIVFNPASASEYLGIVTPLDVVNCLFGR